MTWREPSFKVLNRPEEDHREIFQARSHSSRLRLAKSGGALIGPTGGSLRPLCLTAIKDTNFLVPCSINKLSFMLLGTGSVRERESRPLLVVSASLLGENKRFLNQVKSSDGCRVDLPNVKLFIVAP